MSLLFNFRPLVINPLLAERIGLNEAIVLQQLKYWLNETESGVEHDGQRWVYNTIEQWQRQFPFWSPDTVKRALKSLQKQGLIVAEQLAKARHDHTNHYSINYLSGALIDQGNLHRSEEGKLPQSGGAECPDLHTEITTKTTPETFVVFERFWKLYPRKVDKVKAEKAWIKLNVTEEMFAVIATVLARQCQSVGWLKSGGQFIPHPTTWINGNRWEDEPLAAAAQSHHTDLDQIDHTEGLVRQPDGSYRVAKP
ncbi:hypothetical protein [Pseudomonas petrae]|uniref:hypothetical protein n=1 Tax=Pseudomonas petrae TaxID=2912190 RepID=UPI001F342E6A|nr:hypothetical protein [Pseudomonas petrae]MCF7558887.1 hypothetical protein [Pseudomonas petrae]